MALFCMEVAILRFCQIKGRATSTPSNHFYGLCQFPFASPSGPLVIFYCHFTLPLAAPRKQFPHRRRPRSPYACTTTMPRPNLPAAIISSLAPDHRVSSAISCLSRQPSHPNHAAIHGLPTEAFASELARSPGPLHRLSTTPSQASALEPRGCLSPAPPSALPLPRATHGFTPAVP